MRTKFATELKLVGPSQPAKGSDDVMRVLTLPQDAERLCADVRISWTYVVRKNNVRELRKSRSVHVRRHSQLRNRIDLRKVSDDTALKVETARVAIGKVHDHAGAERVRVGARVARLRG